MFPIFALTRPRTLPLAVATVISAHALAYQQNHFNWHTFALSLLTVLLLQITSNIANDYGDGIRGTDTHRAAHAPKRYSVASAQNAHAVKRYLIIAVIASIISGIALLSSSLKTTHDWFIFLLLGATALIAALAYTIGRYAYGYYALGEVAVFLTFGWLGTLGNYYLQTHSYHPSLLLPATGSGLLAAAVLHINNIRDRQSDLIAGKRTLANYCSFSGSLKLQKIFLLTAFACYALYGFIAWQSALSLASLPLVWRHICRLNHANNEAQAGQELAAVVKIHFCANSLFAVGLILFS
ncbi:1,4-dihydroxy-2-naphthoate octaprenyltransferase [Kingella negevensis]|uniref:1,4-dihydroxy-2-naphthoate octaprenyltransferase n=2 Tax=Kingella negevensis TaxID=1522312 RepID=A0A238HF60_9NEIS|nr:1,4-dihydroxy-2-naphthoate octaprenyltransferase [Kingella negevensis]MDK4696411.1 1,4-dihydroxy-2-naphthoate octaprenyltransferase [Kingella negevensis]WII93248.1 1,4-dihydroxy-2-naphthoate octaprenyltransferase [Kingella negevensis]SNB63594.1 1,4-dihydroxy-2-naphthoate octaprenyltransferase [Kingella negevensis]